MKNTIIAQNLEKALKAVYQRYLNEFQEKIRLKKGMENVQHNLQLVSGSTEKLSMAIVNKSVDLINEYKIRDSEMIDFIINLNQQYIRQFKTLVNSLYSKTTNHPPLSVG